MAHLHLSRGFRVPLAVASLAGIVGLLATCKSGSGGSQGAGTGNGGTTGAGGAGLTGSGGGGPGDGGSGGGDPQDGAQPGFTRADLLAAFGACAASAAGDFRDRAAALDASTAALVAAPGPDAVTAARDAFRAAMDSWQVMEMLQFGPTGRPMVAGGQDFRDNIYAWPLNSRCAVEEQVVARGYEAAGFPTSLVNRRGLAAIEYLLFYEGADTACPATSPAVAGWAALAAADRDARKRAYAAAAAHDIAARAAALATAWDPAGGNFPETLRTSGPGNAVYPTTQQAFNNVSNALFYVESETKDMKLARPLGLDMVACTTDICPEQLESRYAGRSKANVRVNLDGMRRLLEGCQADHAGLGFDDLLVAVGAGALADTLKTRAIAAETALEAIDEPDLDLALMQDKASVRTFYDALKGVTDLLKTDFVTVLDLELPATIGTDND